ncbi:hypothetical protein C2S51_005990 [Perilla frutescens var. frutescens]|nr:hypothetical protein C2S51_005990 [Perilla frutescens var. frutescens]
MVVVCEGGALLPPSPVASPHLSSAEQSSVSSSWDSTRSTADSPRRRRCRSRSPQSASSLGVGDASSTNSNFRKKLRDGCQKASSSRPRSNEKIAPSGRGAGAGPISDTAKKINAMLEENARVLAKMREEFEAFREQMEARFQAKNPQGMERMPQDSSVSAQPPPNTNAD